MRDTKWAMSLAETLRGAESLTFPAIAAITLADEVKSLQSALSEATARAERAEAELKKAREQEPYGYLAGRDFHLRGVDFVTACPTVKPLYAAPTAQVPKDATCKQPLQVPAEWREVLSGLVAIAEKKGKKQGSPNHCHQRPGIWDDDNGPALSGKPCAECAMYDKARALIQQSEVKP